MAGEITRGEFVRGSIWVYLGTGGAFILGLFTNIILARALDAELFGVLSVALVVVGLATTFSEFGINTSVVYFSSHYHTRGKQNKLTAYVSTLLKYKIYLVLLVAVAMFLVADPLAEIFNAPSAGPYFRVATLYFIFQSLFNFFVYLLSGLRKFSKFLAGNVLMNILKFVLAPGLVFYGLGVSGALFGFILASGVSCLVTLYWARGVISTKAGGIDNRDALNYSFHSAVAGFGGNLYSWADSIILSVFLNPVYVGFYKIAQSLSWAASGLISSGLVQILFPSFTSMLAWKKKGRLLRYADNVLKYGFFVSIPAVVGLALLSWPITKVLYGNQYMDAAPVLAILSFFCLDGLLISLISSFFNALKAPKILSKMSLVMGALSIILNLVFVFFYGILGAAIGTILARIAGIGVGAYYLNKVFKIKLRWGHAIKPLIASGVMGVFLYILMPLVKSIVDGLLLIGGGVLVYIFAQMLLGFNVKELFDKIIVAVKEK